jgi:dCTP deaminase
MVSCCRFIGSIERYCFEKEGVMGILTRDVILKEIEKGTISIDPFDPKMVKAGSIDLRLGNTFRIFSPLRKTVAVTEDSDYRDVTRKLELSAGENFLLMPGETVLGMTMEKITLPSDICGWLEGRSRFARLGLLVHISASFMQPGISNQQVLEMSNFGPAPLEIYPGIPICQFIFQRTEGAASYEGHYRGQDSRNW